MKKPDINKAALIISFVFVTVLLLLNVNNGFFWDTVLYGSKIPNYYYSNNFSHLLLPDELDSGHIPAFGIYIAAIWQIFGRTLLASHLSMLPFALGIVWQVYLLCSRFVNPKYVGFALLLVIIDPSLLSQLTLVSPDVPLVFFFLLAVNAVLKNSRWIFALSIMFLFMMSLRGMTLSVCLLFLDLYLNVNFKTRIQTLFSALLKRSLLYFPGLLVALFYYSYHFHQKGWLMYHADSPWVDNYKLVGTAGFLFNIGLFGWRLLDFGKIGVWLVFILLVLRYRKLVFKTAETRLLFFLCICLMVLMPLNLLWAKNLLAHRYFIPIYVIFSLLCARVLFSDFVNNKWRNFLSAIWLIAILSGNFWIYPPKIAEGWDSTLAHLPYYELRHEAIAYLDKQQIPLKQVQSFFPNCNTLDQIDLNGDTHTFAGFDGSVPYVFYSNVYNAKDAVHDEIIKNYHELKRFEKRGVYIVIYNRLSN